MLALLACASVASSAFAADELALRGSSLEKLTGTVTAIEQSGVIVLASPLTGEPLRLKPGAVKRVHFGKNSAEPEPSPMLVELANGDRLPVQVTSYSAEKGMQVTSSAIGEILIPPSALSSLELGIPARKLVFEGPGDIAGWKSTSKDGFDRVGIEGKDWTISGRLEASRQFNTPENFVLAFTLQWPVRQQPNIRIHFASPDATSVTKADRYFLQFSSAGFEVKRERTKTSGFPSILVSKRRPDEFNGRKVDVEIRVNRSNKRIELFLNGELESWGIDPESSVPTGGGIILGINGMNGTSHTIRDLTLSELDNTRARHRAEDRGNDSQDSLLSRDDDRWAGKLLAIRTRESDTDFLFQTTLRKEPLEIPIDDISTVFFRKPDVPAPNGPAQYRLQLQGEGGLSVKSCIITDGKITVDHPLLGKLQLNKQAILGIEPVTGPESKEEDKE